MRKLPAVYPRHIVLDFAAWFAIIKPKKKQNDGA
jgi:hypothetical protein